MSRDIQINADDAGDWIMQRAGGVFTPETDHTISSHYGNGQIRGGFALCGYLGASMTVHVAGNDELWCTRDLLWMMFHYVFRQLGCRKLIAPTPSTNYHALDLNLRAGFRLEAVLRDATVDGHLMLLTMEARNCRWLRVKPQRYFPGDVVRKLQEAV